MRVVTVLLALAAVAVATFAWWSAPEASVEARTVPIEVIGPDGPIWLGNATGATAHEHLLDAAGRGGFDVESMGSGPGLIVTRIAEFSNEGAGGWCYFVLDGEWTDPPVSAAISGVGDGVRWEYRVDGCPSS